MARRDSQGDRNIRAVESGARIQHSRQNIRERQADRAERARQFDQTLWQRQWEDRRARRREKEQQEGTLAERQAQKPRTTVFGTEGYLKGQEPKPVRTGDRRMDAQIEQRRNQLDEEKRQFDVSTTQQQQQFETSTELSAAKAGLEPAGGDRLGALQAEMQRQQQQMGQGLEQTGRRGFVSTPETQREGQRKAGLDERGMQVKEMNARANWARARTAYEKASADVRSAKTATAKKEAQAKRKLVEQTLMEPIKSSSAMLDRFMKEKESLDDWQALAALINNKIRGVPPVGSGRAIHDELESKIVGPRITSFLSEKVAIKAIEFAYATGKMPDGNLVNFASEGMQEFSRRAREARQLLLPNTVAGQLLSAEQVSKIKRGYEDHIEMVNKLAALLVLKQQPSSPAGALTGQEAPKYEHRRADPTKPPTPAERTGQITPEEAAIEAEKFGGQAAPKTGKKRYEPPAPMGTRGGLSGNLPYGV